MENFIIACVPGVGMFLSAQKEHQMANKRLNLFLALNAAAVSLQRSARSEAEVYATYRHELARLGLRGNLSFIDCSGENLVMQVIFIPDVLGAALKKVEGITELNAEGLTFPIAQVPAYQRAIATKQAVFIPDSREIITQFLPEPLRIKADMVMDLLGSITQIIAPLVNEEKVIGVMTLGSMEGVTQEDTPIVEAFANHFSTALENARLFAAIQRQAQERELLDRVLTALARNLELADVIRAVVRAIADEFGYTQVSVYWIENGQLHIKEQVGYDNVIQWIPITKGVAGRVARTGRPVFLKDVGAEPEFIGAIPGITSEICIPLFDQGQAVGVLNVESVRVQLTEADLRLMMALGEHINLAIERARLYEEIRHFNAELEQRVRERTTQLQAALEELETFSYSVSHDLRAPLRGIQGFSHIILEKNTENLDGESKRQLISITESAKRMGKMIDALLQFSRLTRAEFQKKELDLSQMAQAIFVELKENNPERNVQIEIQAGLKSYADQRFMQIALENLLSNAWKFTSKTPDALISVGREAIEGEQAFFVRDNGAGFNMEYTKKLFGPFQRLHREDEFPGEGAGLAIVQRIIQRHGGRIWANAKPGEGAVFYFTLP